MKLKIFLHMGSHKTGTTTLQSILAKNRCILRKAGLVYPNVDDADSHFLWARSLAGEMPQITPSQHLEITAGLLKDLKQQEALLLSAESFYRHINNQPGYLFKIQSVLGDSELTPVLCLRNQGDYAKSLYSEWVLNWQYQHDIYNFIREFYAWFDYEKFVAKISLLGKPILLSYHQIAGDNLSSNFIGELGYSVELIADSSHLRQSPSDAEVYLKRLLNKQYPQSKHRTVVMNTIKKVISSSYPELKLPMPSLIWQGALDSGKFERSYRLSNLRLCEQFGKDNANFFPYRSSRPAPSISADILLKLDDAYRLILQKLGNI